MHTRSKRRAGARPDAHAYLSEFEQFMNDFMARHPEVEEDRRRAWYIWWDHNYDPDEIERLSRSEVPFKPYD